MSHKMSKEEFIAKMLKEREDKVKVTIVPTTLSGGHISDRDYRGYVADTKARFRQNAGRGSAKRNK